MNKKAISGDMIVILCFVLFFGFLFGLVHFSSPNYNQDCMKEYAVSYCESINRTYTNNGEYIWCGKDKRKAGEEKFAFTDEERESCVTKEAKSFRRVK